MAHVIERATTGRAKCRGCAAPIATGTLRFGERLPNPFGEGDTTHWFHLDCGAFKRPQSLLEALAATEPPPDDAPRLEAEAKRSLEHERLARIDGAERASSGRAQCRSCTVAIDKGAWRVKRVFYEEDRFVPAGFIHTRCAPEYFGTPDVFPRVKHFSPGLGADDLEQLRTELGA